MNKETALYYSLVACDKMILNCSLRVKYIESLGKDALPKEKENFQDIINQYEQVKQVLKESLENSCEHTWLIKKDGLECRHCKEVLK